MRTKHMVPTRAYDLIGGLPDDICGHILSFLPMNEAVATSVLSKRWRRAWTFSPVLDLDLSLFPQTRGRKAAFAGFADSAVALFALPNLTKFRLSLDDASAAGGGLESWLAFAVARRVQDLELCLPRARTMRLPDCIFDCGSITSLKLRLRSYAFELPSPAGLPGLRVLHLASISSPLKGSFFEGLFSYCLMLEELVVEECRLDALDIDGARKLRSLVISECNWVHPLRIKISAPGLQSFEYTGRAADDHCLENLSCLDDVVLDLTTPSPPWKAEEDCQQRLVKLFEMVGGAATLTLSSWCIKHLASAPGLPDNVQGVKHLVLFMECRQDSLGTIPPLLMSCSYLETLSVTVTPSQSMRKVRVRAGEKQRKLEMRRMMRRLKTVKLENIDASSTGLQLVQFLLKNSRALEKMTIVPSKEGLEHAKFRRKVSTFPRASRSVAIEYCSPE